MQQQIQYHLCFETLANELRIKIIEQLSGRSMSVNELAEQLGAERSRVSHSLYMLKGCKVVNVKKQGKKMLYSLSDRNYLSATKPGNSLFAIINEHVENCCTTCYKLKE